MQQKAFSQLNGYYRCASSERALDAKRMILQSLHQQLASCKADLQEEVDRREAVHAQALLPATDAQPQDR